MSTPETQISSVSTADPPSGPTILLEAARRQRGRVLSAAAAIRLGGALLMLLISLVSWLALDNEEWSSLVPPLIGYGTLALITFMAQGRAVLVRVAWVQPLLDVGFAYAVLRATILLGAQDAPSMAGLGVAVLLLPVAFAGLAFRTRVLVMVTVAAGLANLSLMSQADLAFWPMSTASAVLLLAASASKLARETVEAEITRRMLAESHARCEALSHLQAEKDSLLGIIVHDMRSPVNSALLSLEYLDEHMGRHVAARTWTEAVKDALSSCSNLSEMISQIQDTTKLEARRMTMHMVVVDVRQTLDEARARTSTHARSKSISIELDAPQPLPAVIDPRLLLRTVESLITCAIKQTPTGGRILLQAIPEGGQAKLAVHRSGQPIPAEERAGLFEKFGTGARKGPRLSGWGLGLYFCRLGAEAHHASIAVESCEGWASAYVLRLPLLSAVADEIKTGESSTQLAAGALPPAPASGLFSVRRTPSSAKTQAALSEFARTLAPLASDMVRAR
jgi:two-component system, OmpR family, heavy metal sensor histidine kinase CusS